MPILSAYIPALSVTFKKVLGFWMHVCYNLRYDTVKG